MNEIRAQYEAYPYPERDPADEAKRLIVGSPSDPVEIDHYLFQGKRDWRKPFKALVAGGGTGDGLVQLAAKLSARNVPYDITYIDLSDEARRIAQARIQARGLSGVTFHTRSLLDAPEYGPFDYIDCTGVLHHLPVPDEGFRALSNALAPEGGMGLMVYAPYGRTGVYPLQQAFASLTEGASPPERLALGRTVMDALPQNNWFLKNTFVGDHKHSDAGFYDLLLHSQDQPYSAPELIGALARAGLNFVSFTEPARYDVKRYLPPEDAIQARADALDPVTAMGVAEQLAGDIKMHIAYAVPAGRANTVARMIPAAVPRMKLDPRKMARAVAKQGGFPITYDGGRSAITLPSKSAALIALADGRLELGQMAQNLQLDWFSFAAQWAGIEAALIPWGLLKYSRTFR